MFLVDDAAIVECDIPSRTKILGMERVKRDGFTGSLEIIELCERCEGTIKLHVAGALYLRAKWVAARVHYVLQRVDLKADVNRTSGFSKVKLL